MKNINENGRSMIEMLGVLAIIGVLSVGGIMGYSKAMSRYKINKTIEQITYIAGNVRTTFASQGNYQGLTSECPANRTCITKKAHIFPDDMWKDGVIRPQNVWDDDVYVWAVDKNGADTQRNKAFCIVYNSLPEEACVELVTRDWSDAQVELIYVYDDGIDNDFSFIPPAKLDDAVKICKESPLDLNNVAEIHFYFDIDTSDSNYKSWIDETTEILSGL